MGEDGGETATSVSSDATMTATDSDDDGGGEDDDSDAGNGEHGHSDEGVEAGKSVFHQPAPSAPSVSHKTRKAYAKGAHSMAPSKTPSKSASKTPSKSASKTRSTTASKAATKAATSKCKRGTPAPPKTRKVPGTQHAGHVHSGFGRLYTGSPVHLHMIDGSSVRMSELCAKRQRTCGGGKEFTFSVFVVQDNATLTQVLESLGPVGEAAKVTEIFELGDGAWRKGKGVKMGDEAADKTLAELGWVGSGGFSREPVWLYLKKAGGK